MSSRVTINWIGNGRFIMEMSAKDESGKKQELNRPLWVSDEDDIERAIKEIIGSGVIYANQLLGNISTKH